MWRRVARFQIRGWAEADMLYNYMDFVGVSPSLTPQSKLEQGRSISFADIFLNSFLFYMGRHFIPLFIALWN